MNRLRDNVALITGSGSGIGRAVAVLFASEGAAVVVNDLNEKGGRETVELIEKNHGKAMFLKADVTKAVEVRALVDSIIQAYHKIDILHNNVGGWQKAQQDTVTLDSDEEWDRLISLNLKGTFLCSKYVIPHMIKNGGGKIINTVTTSAFMNGPNLEAYGAAKGGVKELTRSMCLDYARYNIRINGIVPGEVRTPMWEGSFESLPDAEKIKKAVIAKIPMGRIAEPEDIALGVLFLASDDSRYVNGSMLFVDGGYTAGSFDFGGQNV